MWSCQQKETLINPSADSSIKFQEEPKIEIILPEKSDWLYIPNTASKIVSDFGSLIGVSGKKRKVPHQGVDIHDIPGTSILAARDGTILEIHDEKCWGLTVTIDHGPEPGGEKLYALYGH